MKLEWQIKNAIAASHFLLGTKRGHKILSDPQKLMFFLQGKANGTLSVEDVIIDDSLGYAGARRGEYLAFREGFKIIGQGNPYFFDLPEYKDNQANQLTPDFAVNMWSYENRKNYRKTSLQELQDKEYLEVGEATFESKDMFWRTPVYQVTPKGNGLIRLERYVKKQPRSEEISDLLFA